MTEYEKPRTISALEARVAELQAENAKLRESLEFANNEREKDSSEFLNLQAENAKLREEVKVVGTVAYVHGMKRLESENAKLRELARKLAWCSVVTDCSQCQGACEDGDEWPKGSAICTGVERMMSELGIEGVDG